MATIPACIAPTLPGPPPSSPVPPPSSSPTPTPPSSPIPPSPPTPSSPPPTPSPALARALALISPSPSAVPRTLVFFLDYDGTLTPIVSNPELAFIPPATQSALRALAARHTTAVVSGRSLEKVQRLVGVSNLIYAGSHGFDISCPAIGLAPRTVGEEWRPALVAAAAALAPVLSAYAGTAVEDNKLSMSLHYRNCAALAALDPSIDPCAPSTGALADLVATVDGVATAHGLRRTRGKCVLELRPDVDWHKGKAVSYLLHALALDRPDVLPVYVGDDVTDEDAFATLREREGGGVGVRVGRAGKTEAHVTLRDTDEVRLLLRHFAGE